MGQKIREDLVGVVFVHRDGGADPRQLNAGDEVPEGYVVGDHLLATAKKTRGDDPAGSGDGDGDPQGAPPSGGQAPAVPAKSGPGSGKGAWAEYAKTLGVEVPQDAGRDDIVAAVQAAGHPVE